MIEDSEIVIPAGIKYLGEYMDMLPENCIFNKSVVGSGGTTVALTCKYNYVICVPFVSLIQNKIAQHKGILGVYKDTKVKEIKEYLADKSIEYKKIMVTYDSLSKLEKYLNPKDYKLLVDEYHLLFNCYSFRNKAIKKLLTIYETYQSYCFMTATLLEREFILTELKDVPIVTATWDTVKEVTVHSIRCQSNVIHTVANLVNEFLEGKKEGNAYFFVNSVEFIKNVVETCNLNDTNARAIWSNNNKLQTGLERGKTLDVPKKINLLTSTVFEGADFYDEDGKIFIVSDGTKTHTIVDISTSFQQIAGRIRTSKYSNYITHIYSQTRYSINATYDDYKKASDLEIIKNKEFIQDFLESKPSIQAKLLEGQLKNEKENNIDGYLRAADDTLIFDENLVKIDLYNFKVTKSIYKIKVNLTQEYQKHGFSVEKSDAQTEKIVVVKPKMPFKETVIECQKGDADFILAAYKQFPFLEEAINKIGYKGIEDSKYSISGVKRKIIRLSSGSDKQKILQSLKNSSYIYEGAFIETSVLKRLMAGIYEDLQIQLTPKAVDVQNYYHTKNHTKKIKTEVNKEVDGKVITKIVWKSVQGFIIVKSKM